MGVKTLFYQQVFWHPIIFVFILFCLKNWVPKTLLVNLFCNPINMLGFLTEYKKVK